MKVVGLLLGALSLAVLSSCASKDDATTVPTNNGFQFDTLSYTLQPGEEKYFCYTMTLPTDKDSVITEFAPQYGKAVHHFAFYYTLVQEKDGFSECPVLFKDTWVPLFEGGKDSGKLALPAGSAVRLKGQQLLIQLHLVNATKAPITEKSGIFLKTVDPATKTTSAGLFGFDNRVIEIPPKSMGTEVSMTCAMDKDMDVFAIMGHMHTRGHNIQVSRGAKPGDEILYETKWNFDVQPTTPINFKVKKGDNVHLKCSWNNESDKTLKYGESTFDEMCAFVWYYTPYDKIDGCVKSP